MRPGRRYDYTDEYLEKENLIRLANNRKYIKTGLRHLMKHCKGEEILAPKQIQFIIQKSLEGILLFRDSALDYYNDLPENIKQEIEKYYNDNLQYSTAVFDYKHYIPQEITEEFYHKQAENYENTIKSAETYLEDLQ